MHATRRWTGLRGPLQFALLLGGCASLIVSGRLSATLIAGSTLAWGFIPAFDVAAFAAVRRRTRPIRTFANDLERFSASLRPWTLLLVGVAAFASFLTPMQVSAWSSSTAVQAALSAMALAVLLRTAYLDFRFFLEAMNRSPRAALGDVVLHRAISWTAAAVYFGGFAGWPIVARWVGL